MTTFPGDRDAQPRTVPFGELISRCARLLEAVDVPAGDAYRIAETFVLADAEGAPSHGLARLPRLVQRIQAGLVDPRSKSEVVHRTLATAVMDGHHGVGQIIADRAMEIAIDAARKVGLGAVSVRRSSHFGRASHPALLAADMGLIGIASSNGSPRLAASAGTKPFLGNNPWAIAWPSREGPYCLDLANSLVAAGKIRAAEEQGHKIPEGWALDARGEPTTDASEALRGSLIAMGGHKGWGISLALDILSGALSGGAMGPEVGPIDDMERRQNTSHFFAAIDIAAFVHPADFEERATMFASALREASGGQARLPGQRSKALRERHRVQGLPISTATAQMIARLEADLGVTPDKK